MQNISKLVQVHVEDTNEIATMAKLSAIKMKYYQDEFSEELGRSNPKNDVIIHRGYWCRFHIFHRIVSQFIQNIEKCNIISLGCGYDSLPFIIWQQQPKKEFTYVEIDLPIVVQRKIQKLNQSNKIKQLLGELIINENKCEAKKDLKKYLIFGQDLRNVEELKQQLSNIDFTLPTLVFAECVLTYIHPDETNLLLENICNWFNKLIFLNYEIFNPNDSFGKLMVKNFEALGCPLLSIDAFPSFEAHITRLNKWFKNVEIYDMKTLYIQGTDSEERKRIEKLEFMDEWEEWNIIQSHYFVSLATKDDDDYKIHLII